METANQSGTPKKFEKVLLANEHPVNPQAAFDDQDIHLIIGKSEHKMDAINYIFAEDSNGLKRPMVIPPFLVGFISRFVFKRRVSCVAQVFGRGLSRLSPC